jgi:hypothetical protein
MTRHIERAAVLCVAPVEQQCTPSHARHSSDKRDFFVEIENPRWIDQRRNEDSRRTFAPVIAQAGATLSRDFGHCRARRAARRTLIGAEPGKRSSGQFGIALSNALYQIEKKRKRTWRAFMLQRTMLQ